MSTIAFRLATCLCLLLPLVAGCNQHATVVVIVQDATVKPIDREMIDLYLQVGNREGWSVFKVEELPSSNIENRTFRIEPVRSGLERFGEDVTIVVRDGVIIEEHSGR